MALELLLWHCPNIMGIASPCAQQKASLEISDRTTALGRLDACASRPLASAMAKVLHKWIKFESGMVST